jgi:YVTN family beta-propeller protein
MPFRVGTWALLLGVVTAAGISCSDPTGPDGTHPEGIVDRTDPLSSRPYGAAVSRHDVVYITQLDNQRLSRIDLPRLGEIDSVEVGVVPTHVAFNRDGTRAYVANQFSQAVGVVDVATNTQVSSIPVSGSVFLGVPNDSDTRLYVVTNTDSLYEIDRGSGARLRRIALGGTGQSMAWHPNGYLLYVSTFTGGSALEVDTRSMTVTRTFVTGSKAQAVVVTRDGSELFVADEDLGKVDVFSLATGERLTSIDVDGNPWGMAITPDQQQLYVGLVFQGEVVVIDRESRAVVRRLDTGGSPRRIVFNQAGTIAVIPNEFGYVTYVR